MSAFLQPSLSLGVVCTIYGLDSLGDGPAKRSNTPPLRTVVLLAVPADPTPSLIALLTRRSRLRSGLCGNQTSRPCIQSYAAPQLGPGNTPRVRPRTLHRPHGRLRHSALVLERDRVLHLRGVRFECHGAPYIRYEGDVDQLGVLAAQAYPLRQVAAPQIDDEHAAPGMRLPACHFVVQRQALEPAVARQGGRQHGVAAHEGQATQEARAEGDVLAPAGLRIDPAQMTGAGVVDPHRSAMKARRMRHRQAFRHDAVGFDVDYDAAVAAMVAPAVDDIGGGAGGDVAHALPFHGDTIEMATVFRRKLGNERRLPDG